MQFNMNPQSLAQLNNVPIDMTLESMDWLRNARQSDSAGLQDMMGQYAHEAATRPLKQQQMQLANDTTLAQLPGVKAQSGMLERKNKMEAGTFDADMQAKLRKLAMDAADDDIKGMEQQGRKLLFSTNPAERKRGEQILGATEFMFKEREKNRLAGELEAQKQRVAKELMQMQIDAGRFTKTPRAGKSPEELIASMGYEKASVYYDARAEAAEDAGDPEAANRFREQANKMKAAYERAKMLQAQAAAGGKVDIGATANIPTLPAPQPQGFTPPANTPPQTGPYTDAEKERRYQEWKARQGQ
jgi:hypothetical protein